MIEESRELENPQEYLALTLDLVFSSEDIDLFNEIVEEANLHKTSYQNMVKRMIKYYQKINEVKDN